MAVLYSHHSYRRLASASLLLVLLLGSAADLFASSCHRSTGDSSGRNTIPVAASHHAGASASGDTAEGPIESEICHCLDCYQAPRPFLGSAPEDTEPLYEAAPHRVAELRRLLLRRPPYLIPYANGPPHLAL